MIRNAIDSTATISGISYCSLLVTTSADQTARVWKTSDFTLLQELKHKAQRWVWDAAFSADSQYILTGNLVPFCFIFHSRHEKLVCSLFRFYFKQVALLM
jgi:hypothetical protein